MLDAGEPTEIKRLYVDLGDDIWETHRGDPSHVPVFSLPGTHVVVAEELAAATGMVLDAGCGPNPALSMALARTGERTVVSLDIGLGTVRSALTVASATGVPLIGIVADVEALPFRAGAFDAVACDDTIEHLPDDAAGIAELARVAGASARVAIATPNRHSLGILRLKARDRVRGRRRAASDYFVSNSHLREYTWGELARLVEPRLRITRRRGVPFEGRRTHRIYAQIASELVTRRPFQRVSPMIVLVAVPRDPLAAE